MQQLVSPAWFLHWQKGDSNIELVTSYFPDDAEFDSWTSQWLEAHNFQLIQSEQGGDRKQCLFRTDNADFLLCYEQICEAIWIEAIVVNNEQRLLDRLLFNLPHHNNLSAEQ